MKGDVLNERMATNLGRMWVSTMHPSKGLEFPGWALVYRPGKDLE